MNAERIREELSMIEFQCEGVENGICWNVITNSYGILERDLFCYCPIYESRDDLQRIIDGMDDDSFTAYLQALCRMQVEDGENPVDCFRSDRPFVAVELLMRSHRATVEQIQEAILRAYGKWEEKEQSDEMER